jgi:hypothetical protein
MPRSAIANYTATTGRLRFTRGRQHGAVVPRSRVQAERAVTIGVNHEAYVNLVIEVDDPAKTVREIREAIAPKA